MDPARCVLTCAVAAKPPQRLTLIGNTTLLLSRKIMVFACCAGESQLKRRCFHMNQDYDDPRPEVVPGERIFLSLVRRDDLPLFARWFSDLELNAYLGQPGMVYTPEQEADWYERVSRDRDTKTFAIVVRDGQRLIGTVSLMNIHYRRQRAELGIAIGDKSAWGQGYGSEAVRLMCDYGFTFLSLYSIYLWHWGFNARAHQAYLKAGFKPAGRLRGADLFNGQRYDDILMDMTRDDFGPSGLLKLMGQITQTDD